ncbi:MAG: hypothetical protein QXR76_05700 [Candidatus Bathyarchaeia archaeon]
MFYRRKTTKNIITRTSLTKNLTKMRYEWQATSNINQLSKQAEYYFKTKNFIVKTEKSNSTVKISAIPNKNTEIKEKIDIQIRKTEKGIAINFNTTEEKEKIIKIETLLTFLTGGGLLLKEIKSKEKLEALQQDFLAYIQKIISESQS